MKKYLLALTMIFMSHYCNANTPMMQSELNTLGQNLNESCAGEDYPPLQTLNEVLKQPISIQIKSYQLSSIFGSGFIHFIDDKKCALAAIEFSISGTQFVEKYKKDIGGVSKDYFLNTIIDAAGEASLYQYMWTLDPKYFSQANQYFERYLDAQKYTEQEVKTCAEHCKTYVYLPNKKMLFDPTDYYFTSMAYNDLFREFIFKYSTEMQAGHSKYFKLLNDIFDRTDQLEIKYIKETGLMSFGNEVATLENFQQILNSPDQFVLDYYVKRLDVYLQNRINQHLLDTEMTKKIYLFLNNQSSKRNALIERMNAGKNENGLFESFKIAKHEYIFQNKNNHLTLSFK